MKILKLFLFVICLSSFYASAELFAKRDHVLDIELITDFKELTFNKHRYSLDQGIKGQLRLQDRVFDVEIMAGGQSRYSCLLPPLKLEFEKSQIKGTIFEKQRKLKLVTHCGKNYSDLVLNEFVYREYNYYQKYQKKTEYHLKTQLLRVRYSDANMHDFGLYRPVHLGFFIESDKSVEERTGSVEIKFSKLHGKSDEAHPDLKLDQKHYKMIRTFNSLIRNGDWHVQHKSVNYHFLRKNVKVFAKNGVAYPIPYDFDRTMKLINHNFKIYHSKKYLPLEEQL
jgi:hypothetical protein